MTRDRTEADIDARNCHALAIAAMREISIRKHQFDPLPSRPREQKWAAEGFTDIRNLDTVRGDAT